MEKFSIKKENPHRPHRKKNGECPYCDTNSHYIDQKKTRSNGYTEKHLSCGKYSFMNERNGQRYPLQNPENPNSNPYI